MPGELDEIEDLWLQAKDLASRNPQKASQLKGLLVDFISDTSSMDSPIKSTSLHTPQKTPGLFSKIPPTPQHIKELSEHFLHCIEIDNVMYSYNLLDGSVYSLGSLQLEHAEPKAEIKKNAAKELEEIRTTPSLLANFIRKHISLTRHWSLRKDLDTLVTDLYNRHSLKELKAEFRTAKGLSDRKAPNKLDFTLWLLENKPTVVDSDITNHDLFSNSVESYVSRIHKSYSLFLFEDETNHWLLDAHGNLQKSGSDFCDWLSESVLNRSNPLVTKYSNTLIDYLHYYSSQSPDYRQTKEEFMTQLMEDLSTHIGNASNSEIFQRLFVVEGAMIKIGGSKMGLGESLQHFYLKTKAPKIRITQLLHTKNEMLADIVDETLNSLDSWNSTRSDRIKVQSLIIWLLRNLHQNQIELIDKFIESISNLAPRLVEKLNMHKQKQITLFSPSGAETRATVENALAITLGFLDDK